MFRALVVSCVLLSCAGCDRALLEIDHLPQPDLSGTLRVPLTATDEQGRPHRLTQATFEISGTALLTLATDALPEPALSTPLPSGAYSLFLRPGFRVLRRDEAGAEQPVEATLAAPNPVPFQLDRVGAVTVKLAFRVGDETLTFGATPPVRVTLAP